ncbi:hypothetical protein TanjilG_28900 [Lupinus angustifolius]|uniref:Uncharacterized protein n=1 Tax=Lupinus angustifolius TaxID=3871 RepID=A0A4P1QXW2_LUPAN|nr:hypothetical protein TanjilG_28900 [Lupinus angustifolius]
MNGTDMVYLLPFPLEHCYHFLFSSPFASKIDAGFSNEVADMQTFVRLVGFEAGQKEVDVVGKYKAEIEEGLGQGMVSELMMRSHYVVVQYVVAAVGEELPPDSDIVGTKEIDHVKMVETVLVSVA